jgi:putative Holliday junction resolvase
MINVQDLPAAGRLLAVDVGEKYLGLAVSDSGQILASPRPSHLRSKWKQDINFFKELVEKEKIVGVVIGHPLTLTGHVGPAADATRSYGELIAQATALPTTLWDERLTTSAAEQALFEQRTGRQTRASKKSVKSYVDSAAATLILQALLDYRR